MIVHEIINRAYQNVDGNSEDITQYDPNAEEIQIGLNVLNQSLSEILAEHEWNTLRSYFTVNTPNFSDVNGVKIYTGIKGNIDLINGETPVRLEELGTKGNYAYASGNVYSMGSDDILTITYTREFNNFTNLNQVLEFEPMQLLIQLMTAKLSLLNYAWQQTYGQRMDDYNHMLATYKAKDIKQHTVKHNNSKRRYKNGLFHG